jgi:hypothetical protein
LRTRKGRGDEKTRSLLGERGGWRRLQRRRLWRLGGWLGWLCRERKGDEVDVGKGAEKRAGSSGADERGSEFFLLPSFSSGYAAAESLWPSSKFSLSPWQERALTGASNSSKSNSSKSNSAWSCKSLRTRPVPLCFLTSTYPTTALIMPCRASDSPAHLHNGEDDHMVAPADPLSPERSSTTKSSFVPPPSPLVQLLLSFAQIVYARRGLRADPQCM